MSVTYGFYNSSDGDRVYDAEQVSAMFDGFVGDGVHMSIGGRLQVRAASGMNIYVSTGRAWFNHTWTLVDAQISMTVPTASSTLSRIDAVVLTVNKSRAVRANSIDYITGTPSAAPSRPSLTNSGDIHQYALAYITVRAGVTSISQSNITNMVGTSSTPFVTGLVQLMSTDDIIAQWQSQWNDWFAAQPAIFEEYVREYTVEMDAWSADAKADFDNWFQNLHYILDGDVAAHLQEEIDAAMTGSIITITTNDSDLYGTAVQLDGPDTHMSTTFDSNGIAKFKGVMDTGTLTVFADDGDAEMDISIPYFGNYSIPLVVFKAIVNITLRDSVLWGKDILVTGPALNKTITSSASGTAMIALKRPGTYTFTVEYDT